MANKKKRKDVEPSKEDATLALAMIKELQKNSDENLEQKKKEEEEADRAFAMDETNKIQIQAAQEKVKRKLRENLEKKAVKDKKNALKVFLESGDKIKWKSINSGYKLEGYVEDKLLFEIKRGLNLFSLYVKDPDLMKKNKINTQYLSCSMNLQKLKKKSEKLI